MHARTTLSTMALALLLAPATVADHDNDPVADGLEPLLCGQSTVAGVITQAGGAAGGCRPGYDYHNPALGQETTCSGGWCSAPLYRSSPPLPPADTPPVDLPPEGLDPVGPIPIPFLDPDTVVLQGYRGDGNDYCIRIDSADVDPPEPSCLNLSGLADDVPIFGPTPLMPYDDLGHTPPVGEGSLGTVPASSTADARLEVAVTAHWDEDRLARRFGQGDVGVWEPVDLLDEGEVEWWRAHGFETRVEVSWWVVDPWGDTVARGGFPVHHLGQAVAAAYRSGA